MSNLKVFLGGNSLLNTLLSSSTTLSKCSISSSSSAGQTNKPTTHLQSNLTNRAAETVPEYLKSRSIKFCQGWNNFNVYNCSKAEDNIFVNENGDFSCLKCNKSGDFSDFKILTSIIEENRDCSDFESEQDQENNVNIEEQLSSSDKRNVKYLKEWEYSEPIRTIADGQLRIILKNSQNELNFSLNTMSRNDMRVFESNILFPVYDLNKKLQNVVFLNLDEPEQENQLVFNGQFLRTEEKTLYITDSILNLIALQDKLTNSAIVIRSVESINQKMLAYLEKYNEIVFWQKDKQLSFSIAKLLNLNRCSMISHAQSSYELSLLKEDFAKSIKEKKFLLKEKSILQFDEFKFNVKDELINAKLYAGVQWKRFPQLNELLKGHRRGELTVFTGPTGSGKTTFLGEYTLDLASQGVKTLWGSFEIKNSKLGKMMMTQFAKLNLKENVNLFEFISKQFAELPFYFMDFHGEQTLENVLQTMSRAVIIHDVRHIIIDNLQFMIGNQTNQFDKYFFQDFVISTFRQFATNFDCHITIVIHPRKEESDLPLKISSIFGSAKASQEADNIIILQDQKVKTTDKIISAKYIQIVKNRHDGELGRFRIKFNKETLCFTTSSFFNDTSVKNEDLTIDNELFKDIKKEISSEVLS